MTREVRILQGAKTDFREIKAYVQKHFGEAVWLEVNQELKEAIGHIAANPMLGTRLEELGFLGYDHFRKTLVRQTRVIYEFDEQQVVVHMFIHTRRDFKTHLEQRLLAPS